MRSEEEVRKEKKSVEEQIKHIKSEYYKGVARGLIEAYVWYLEE